MCAATWNVKRACCHKAYCVFEEEENHIFSLKNRTEKAHGQAHFFIAKIKCETGDKDLSLPDSRNILKDTFSSRWMPVARKYPGAGKEKINQGGLMKRIILLALIAGLSSTVQAQTQPVPASDVENAVRISAPMYTIELPAKPHHLFRGDFDAWRGTYSLSNGEEMLLKQRGRRIYASLGGREEKELVAAAHNVFVAKDRNLKITLISDSFNDQITGEVLIRHPRTVADTSVGTQGPVERLAVR